MIQPRSIRNILVIDDDPADCFITTRIVHHALGTEVNISCVTHGLEAMTFLETHPLPEIIFLDLVMPVMDGYTFLKRFRERYPDHPAHCQVVILTILGHTHLIDTTLTEGAVTILEKPLTSKACLELIQH